MALDYTYAERMNWDVTGKQYKDSLDSATADAVVAGLTSDADYLEALSDKFSGDAEYLAGVGAALAADSDFLDAIGDNLEADADLLTAIGAALAVDATFLTGVQGAVFPVFSAAIAVGAETTEAIAVGIQVKDVADADAAQITELMVYVTGDLAATPDGLPANVTVAATDGVVLQAVTADTIYRCLTDATGLLTLTFTDAVDQDVTLYIRVVLPTGECIDSGAITFVDDTP